MIKKNIAIWLCLLILRSAQAQAPQVFNDPEQPVAVRVQDLISRLTLSEKAHFMMDKSPAIPRLGIPEYNWWNESLHGVGRSGVATIFPQAIGLGATFDENLVRRIASAISDEARAIYNVASQKGYRRRYNGLTFWTPNINIFRDPRWGRGQETYGEDPYLTARLGVAFVRGLQGDDDVYLKTAACAKHFAVHSGPERLRHTFNAEVSLKDLHETFLPAFKALVDADVEAVMCAYNRTNGQPCCASNLLLDKILRGDWAFEGHVVSDCWAIVDFYEGHKTVATQAEAAALAVKHGVNLNCGDEYPALIDAVDQGLIAEAEIDHALATLLKTRFRLGLFDPPGKVPFHTLSAADINSQPHRQLAYEAAVKSMVLLKNNGVLPLRNDLSNYFVTGPNAASIDAMLGNYYGVNPEVVTVLEGIAHAVEPGSQVLYRPGALLDRDNSNPIDWTTPNAATSDATFAVLGITGLIEGEEGESIASAHFGDRLDYNLPANQINFLRKLKAGHDRPVIAIITGGSPMNLAEVQNIADAVLLVWYPGEEGGHAVANILFGKEVPSGRLPITFPASLDQLPPYEDYTMQGRTYRYMKAEPLYPFGYGLSYTTFAYTDITLSADRIKRNDPTEVTVKITNTGQHPAEEVVQLYITDHEGSTYTPRYSLKGIKRIRLLPGEATHVSFTILPEMLMLVNDEGKSVLEKGTFTISIGGVVPGSRGEELGMAPAAKTTLTVK